MTTEHFQSHDTDSERRQAWLASILLQRRTTWFGRFTLNLQRLLTLGRGGRTQLQRKAAVSLAGAALLLSLGVGAMRPPAVHAATITVDGTICTLVDAITAANNDAIAGGCSAGVGADTIDLQYSANLMASYTSAYGSGTGLPVITTDITIEGNGNTIARDGAAPQFRLMAVSGTGSLTFNDTTLTGGYSGATGGAIYVDGGTLLIQNSILTGNGAHDQGGGINMENGTLTVTDSTISNNTSRYEGGGVYNDSGATVIITNSTFSGNIAGVDGGGLYNDDAATLTITNSTFSGNIAENGGGIYLDGESVLTIVNSTFSGNTANDDGGAFYVDEGELILINTTITGNTAGYRGGGLFMFFESAQTTFDRTVMSGNSAVEGDEIYNRGLGTITAANFNIFGHAGQTNPEAFVNFGLGASDLNMTSDGLVVALTDILDTTLADNGGLTDTHALPPGSLAIDFGPTADCAALPVSSLDQRGEPRSIDIPATGNDGGANLCDSGAFEVQLPPVLSYCPVDDNVGTEMTDLFGTGQGSQTKGFRTRKLVVPNSSDVTALYGQLAALDVGVMKYVRFLPQGYPKVQLHAPNSLAYRAHAVSWWGSDLPTDANWVKGQFFWGAKGNKSPRAFVLWPTYETEEEYANVFVTFDESSENHVAAEPGWINEQTQVIAIPETQADGATVIVRFAIVDNDKDNRQLNTAVRVGNVSQYSSDSVPNAKDNLNLYELTFTDVEAGVDEVIIELSSYNYGDGAPPGESAAIIGAAVNYACEVPEP